MGKGSLRPILVRVGGMSAFSSPRSRVAYRSLMRLGRTLLVPVRTASEWRRRAILKRRTSSLRVRPPLYDREMKKAQQELPFRQWGGARRGAGRKRKSARPNVPHRVRGKFRNGALHVTVRIRREVWTCARTVAFAPCATPFRAAAKGSASAWCTSRCRATTCTHALHRRGPRCGEPGARHERPGGADGARAQQGHPPPRTRIRRSLSRPDDLTARGRDRYVLENWVVHATRNGDPAPSGVDPCCSVAWQDCGPPLVAQPRWWMLRVGVLRRNEWAS